MAYLDESGLSRLWNHIMTKLGGKVDKIEGQELATEEYVTNNAVSKSGDTMTGDLNIVRNGTSSDYIDFHMDINESDTGNKTVSSLSTRSVDTILAHTKYNANGDVAYVNGFQITKDYIQVLANSDVASNKDRLFLATTKAVADYVTDRIIVSYTEPPVQEGKIWLKPILEDGETEEM